MRRLTLSKEVVFILIPFFFTTLITSISNWYEFSEKTKELYIKSIHDLSDGNFELDIQSDIVSYQNKTLNKNNSRNKLINNLHSDYLQNNKFPQAIMDSINNNLISISKQIGKVESLSQLLKNKWYYSNTLLELLNSEKDILIAIKNNSQNKNDIYLAYIKHHSKFQASNFLLEKKIKNLKERDLYDFKEIDGNATNYKWLSRLNLLLAFICSVSLLVLIYYSINRKLFK